jgi:hypothetical protein
MRLERLLVRQWRSRPGRALATVASVAVAVGAVVATWVSADASRTGYRRLTEAIDGVQYTDVEAPRLTVFEWTGDAWKIVGYANFNPPKPDES